jgi:hypothetical protein
MTNIEIANEICNTHGFKLGEKIRTSIFISKVKNRTRKCSRCTDWIKYEENVLSETYSLIGRPETLQVFYHSNCESQKTN